MRAIKHVAVVFFMLFTIEKMVAQDPGFSQFFSSPLNINPALTGNIIGKWRIISNYRNQWIGPANPYTTGTISADSKIFQNVPGNYVDENTRVGIGGMMMYDQTMAGALKSNYASFNASGNIRLQKRDYAGPNGFRVRHNNKVDYASSAEHKLGIGLGIIYGNKRLDLNKLSFEEQFTGNGFDTNLPTGESALSNMKPYISTSAGLLYSYINESANFDLGVAAFHFNKPQQTFLNDENQFLATRYVLHANFEMFLTQQLILNTNGVYQKQGGADYFSIGGTLGYYMLRNDREIIFNAGLWYWSDNALIPYAGLTYEKLQIGLSYDITISKLKIAPRRAHTFELCMILRGGSNKNNDVIPSPWK